MVSGVGPPMMSSALDLWGRASRRALRGASLASRPNGESLLEGFQELRMAKLESRIAGKLFQSERRRFQSLLDIWA
jgi:hypothetical protein